ncbi:hypothetical protein D3C86_1217150 [compost metagenome]
MHADRLTGHRNDGGGAQCPADDIYSHIAPPSPQQVVDGDRIGDAPTLAVDFDNQRVGRNNLSELRAHGLGGNAAADVSKDADASGGHSCAPSSLGEDRLC